MKYLIEDATLTAIGDAVRAKNGSNDLIKVSELADTITNLPSGGGGDIEVEPIVLTGNQEYECSGFMATKYIDWYGDTISTSDITSANYMFYYNETIKEVPFVINMASNITTGMNRVFIGCNSLEKIAGINCNGATLSLNETFSGCTKLKEIGFLKNIHIEELNRVFYDCNNLRDFPYIENIFYDKYTNGYGCYLFYKCHSLRNIPSDFLSTIFGTWTSYTTSIYYYSFDRCYALDGIYGMPVGGTFKSNSFRTTFDQCNRLNEVIFVTNEDKTPMVANWGNQTIDLSYYAGYTLNERNILIWNSGITVDKKVYDDATYQALKDDPDWFATDIAYSRYNHDSAVNTINSLPDTSAYLATIGGTNTIKFKGQSGELTDGGAINTLTEEEIAVATAKGWTVSLS